MQKAAVLTAVLLLVLLGAALGAKTAQAKVYPLWNWAQASWYSYHDPGNTDHQGCPGAPALRDWQMTFASLIVPCGARVKFCFRGRCAIGMRTDSGPYVGWRSFDLNTALARALAYTTDQPLRWKRIE